MHANAQHPTRELTVADLLRAFVVETFLYGDDTRPLAETDSLIETEVVDSTGVLELVSFVEERFGLAVADDEIVPENFDTLSRVRAYVDRKLTASGGRTA